MAEDLMDDVCDHCETVGPIVWAGLLPVGHAGGWAKLCAACAPQAQGEATP